MPKKTLALITGLVLVTIILFVIALRTNNSRQSENTALQPSTAPESQVVSPTSVAHSVLTLSPNPVTVGPKQQGSVDVMIDTADNQVTAVQLEFAYDPNVISNVKVVPAELFKNPVVLIDKNTAQTGRYTYAFGITPSQEAVQGAGVVARVTFTAKGTAGQQSQLALLPETLVTAKGVQNSVLKSNTGTLVIIGTPGTTTDR